MSLERIARALDSRFRGNDDKAIAPGSVGGSDEGGRAVEPMGTGMPADLDTVLKLEVPLIVQIAERWMPMEDVMNITPGAILELPKRAEDDLEILINNIPIGMGSAVKVGENFGVRVVQIGDVQQRVEALGGGSGDSVDGGGGDGGASMGDDEAAALAEQMLADQSGS